MIVYALAVDALRTQRLLSKYSRYNASAKGRERVEQYRATSKGIKARFRAEMNQRQGAIDAQLAALGLERGQLAKMTTDQIIESAMAEVFD
jgi:uncharacterized lipoprotein YmbA